MPDRSKLQIERPTSLGMALAMQEEERSFRFLIRDRDTTFSTDPRVRLWPRL